jgi:uncharacterized damage-inducible protein DinB
VGSAAGLSEAAGPYLRMALNNAWANATLYQALSGMTVADFGGQRPGFFPSLCLTLNHVYEVDLYYLDVLEQGGQGQAVFERKPLENPRELETAQAKADQRLIRFCRDLSDAMLGDLRLTERSVGVVDERVDALLLHLFQHQIHHRGQAHVQMHHAGIAPPQLDEFHLEFERAPTAVNHR